VRNIYVTKNATEQIFVPKRHDVKAFGVRLECLIQIDPVGYSIAESKPVKSIGVKNNARK